MEVKDVTKFYKYHLGGQSMLECVCVQGFIQDIKLGGGGGGVGWGNSKVRC